MAQTLIPFVGREDHYVGDESAIILPQCVYCVHLAPGMRCAAYPDGIPQEIRKNLVDHRERYPGDHGIGFTPAEGTVVKAFMFEPFP